MNLYTIHLIQFGYPNAKEYYSSHIYNSLLEYDTLSEDAQHYMLSKILRQESRFFKISKIKTWFEIVYKVDEISHRLDHMLVNDCKQHLNRGTTYSKEDFKTAPLTKMNLKGLTLEQISLRNRWVKS